MHMMYACPMADEAHLSQCCQNRTDPAGRTRKLSLLLTTPHHRNQSSAPLTTAKKHVHGLSKIQHSSCLLIAYYLLVHWSSVVSRQSPPPVSLFSARPSIPPESRGKTDPAWGHCKQVLDKGKTALLCIYCEKLIRGGGINRVKHHLAGKGGYIEACRKVPAVVRHQFNQNIEDLRTKKRKTQEEYAESYGACDDVEREFDEIERNEMRQQQASRIPAPSSRKGVGKQLKGLQSFFPLAATPGTQPSIKSVL
ncbi:hypothetical protein AHAS_Ahas17G0078800 [Arachis hypogaea]